MTCCGATAGRVCAEGQRSANHSEVRHKLDSVEKACAGSRHSEARTLALALGHELSLLLEADRFAVHPEGQAWHLPSVCQVSIAPGRATITSEDELAALSADAMACHGSSNQLQR